MFSQEYRPERYVLGFGQELEFEFYGEDASVVGASLFEGSAALLTEVWLQKDVSELLLVTGNIQISFNLDSQVIDTIQISPYESGYARALLVDVELGRCFVYAQEETEEDSRTIPNGILVDTYASTRGTFFHGQVAQFAQDNPQGFWLRYELWTPDQFETKHHDAVLVVSQSLSHVQKTALHLGLNQEFSRVASLLTRPSSGDKKWRTDVAEALLALRFQAVHPVND